MQLRKLLIALVVLLVAIFVLQNFAAVETRFLFWSFLAPQWMLMVVTFGAGALVAWLASRLPHTRSGGLR